MSEVVIFIIGSIIFAITIYGTVMAGGLALTRRELEERPAPLPVASGGPPTTAAQPPSPGVSDV
jgi:hypothetical protein